MNNQQKLKTATLFSAIPPNESQKKRFVQFLQKQYHREITLQWQEDETIKHGFRLVYDTEVYDLTESGRYAQFKSKLTELLKKETTTIPLLKKSLDDWQPQINAEEIGYVQTVGDGIATVSGLDHAEYGEILLFENNVHGLIQNLNENEVGCILFDDDESIIQGSVVRRTGRTAGIPVGEAFCGRIIDAIGNPIDGAGEIKSEDFRPIESPAPGIIDRQPVNHPLETGIFAIDTMFPIGRGQRELIIGDRQTGKTSIAVDTIINQKDKNMICIYVAIGQKMSAVTNLVNTLKKHDAMDYTVIINASASDPAPMQYIAPYSGSALGEYFMSKGKDVLIVYDDLSKHAIAYRAMSLLLERAPGREAYPGDVFYLHSRLLERSAHLCDEKGGGSMTALPIVETMGGDVSAYIPTNIISITDGQIFLESDLFFAGQRPAINVGLSVSRVGGAAQTKAIKKATGALRLNLAQFREMEIFTQFSSDLDESTRMQLQYGEGLMRMLRQPLNQPIPQHSQVIILITALAHLMQHILPDDVPQFLAGLTELFESEHPEICAKIDTQNDYSDADKTFILRIAKEYAEHFHAE